MARNVETIQAEIDRLFNEKHSVIAAQLEEQRKAREEEIQQRTRQVRDMVANYNAAAADLREKQLALFHKAAELGMEVLYADGLHWTTAIYPSGPCQTPEARLNKALVNYVPDHRCTRIGGIPV